MPVFCSYRSSSYDEPVNALVVRGVADTTVRLEFVGDDVALPCAEQTAQTNGIVEDKLNSGLLSGQVYGLAPTMRATLYCRFGATGGRGETSNIEGRPREAM